MKLNIEIDKNQGRWTKIDGGRKLSFEHHYILGKPLRWVVLPPGITHRKPK